MPGRKSGYRLVLIWLMTIFFCQVYAANGSPFQTEFMDYQGLKVDQVKQFAVSVQTGYQMFTNSTPEIFGTKKQGSSVTAMGGLFLQGEYFISNSFSASVQGVMVLQPARQNNLVRGYDVGVRYYYWGVGNPVVGNSPILAYSLEEKWKQFVEIYFGKRDYQISLSTEIDNPILGETFYQGTYYQVLVGGGFLYNWDPGEDIIFRVMYAPMSFASEGDGVTMQEMSVLLGMRYDI